MLSNLGIVDFFLKLLELHFWRHANCSQGFPFMDKDNLPRILYQIFFEFSTFFQGAMSISDLREDLNLLLAWYLRCETFHFFKLYNMFAFRYYQI